MKIQDIIIVITIVLASIIGYDKFFLGGKIKEGSNIVQQVVEKHEYRIQENQAIEKTIESNLKSLGNFSCAGFGIYFKGLAPIMTRDGLAIALAPNMPVACKGDVFINGERKEIVADQKDFAQGLIVFKINGENFNVVNLVSANEILTGKRFYALGAGANQEVMVDEGLVAANQDKNHLLAFYGGQAKEGWLVFDFSGDLMGIVRKQGEQYYLVDSSALKEMLSKKK